MCPLTPSPPEGQDNSLEQRSSVNFVGLPIFTLGKEFYPKYPEPRVLKKRDSSAQLCQGRLNFILENISSFKGLSSPGTGCAGHGGVTIPARI